MTNACRHGRNDAGKASARVATAVCGALAMTAPAGCGSPDTRIVKTKVPEATTLAASNRAIIVLAAQHRKDFGGIFGDRGHAVRMVFATRRPVMVNENGKQVAKRFVIFRNNGRARAIAVPPGEYALTTYGFYANGKQYRYQAGGWHPRTGRPYVLGFTVAAGEVVYLGHLQTRHTADESSLRFTATDQHKDARTAVQVAYPGEPGKAILARMRTRILKVPRGEW